MATKPEKDLDDLWEQIVRTSHLQVDINLKQQQQRFAPWQLIFTGVGAGAGLVAATVALTKIVLG